MPNIQNSTNAKTVAASPDPGPRHESIEPVAPIAAAVAQTAASNRSSAMDYGLLLSLTGGLSKFIVRKKAAAAR